MNSGADGDELVKKVYEVEPLACPHCTALMRIIDLIEKLSIVERILKHLNRWRLILPSIVKGECPLRSVKRSSTKPKQRPHR